MAFLDLDPKLRNGAPSEGYQFKLPHKRSTNSKPKWNHIQADPLETPGLPEPGMRCSPHAGGWSRASPRPAGARLRAGILVRGIRVWEPTCGFPLVILYVPNTTNNTHTHTPTRTRTRARARARAHARTHARMHARTHARTQRTRIIWCWAKIKPGYGTQVLVHVYIYLGSHFREPICDPHPLGDACWRSGCSTYICIYIISHRGGAYGLTSLW